MEIIESEQTRVMEILGARPREGGRSQGRFEARSGLCGLGPFP